MKGTTFYALMATGIMLAGCGQNDQNAEADAAAKRADSLATSECFVAIDSNDKANMTLKTLEDGKVKGTLVINYVDKGKNDGTFEGKFSGDTLFVDYTFKIGTENPTVYKNPLAFLKYKDSLVLGVGQIETSLGRSYFVKDKPIRFDRSKFTFGPTDCEEVR